ncbi:MAG TPA: DNA repair protein RecN [Candidatus Kapabacteria bacterium]|nr:DNA repair protein RecN [Candidatus Kapabacteria bacterium]
MKWNEGKVLSYFIILHSSFNTRILLRSLYIKNYALIEEFSVIFERGLNIITGETGAGKSIVLGAFGLLIGDRATPGAIREGAEKAIVEADFDIAGNPSLLAFFAANEIECEDDTLLIRREVSKRGTSRGFINDSPASTQLLKELSEFLVDLHGQHEHQSLLHARNHIRMLDDYAGLGTVVAEFQVLRITLVEIRDEIASMKVREARSREEHDLYAFQLEEILSVDPTEGEDDAIEGKLRVLENAEELQNAASEIQELIYEGEGSVTEKLGFIKEQLARLSSVDTSLTEPLTEARSALAIVTELSRWIREYAERISLDPESLAALRSRAQKLVRLKKKFGGTLDAVLRKKLELEEKLSFENEVEQQIAAKEKQMSELRAECARIAAKLSKARGEYGRKLEPQIVEVLRTLGIEHGKFSVEITSNRTESSDPLALTIGKESLVANMRGVDSVEFYISTNAGEPSKPLARVASGGEISRIMLALKTILAKSDRLPLLIFDEIDIGISGRVAQRVGQAMKRLSEDHQIISITHLAQIAACAEAHFVAEKSTIKGVTSSRLRRISDSEHVEEVARLISGDVLSKGSLENARSLISEAEGKNSKQYVRPKASIPSTTAAL